MFEIDIHRQVAVAEDVIELLETAVSVTLQYEKAASPASLTLVLTDDAQLQQLNQSYRHMDTPTDVLSFPAGKPLFNLPGAIPYLGDIIISVPYAVRQAKKEKHATVDELQLLTVHGTLHLLGHDHMERVEKKKMWAVQTAVLEQLNVQIKLPDEDTHAG